MDRTQGGNIDEEENSGIKSIKANEISQPDKLDEKVITDNSDDYSDDSDYNVGDPEEGIGQESCLKCTPLGGMFVLCECNTWISSDNYPTSLGTPMKDSKLRWVVGPYWNMLLMTYAVIITITVLVYFTVINSQDTLFIVIGLVLSVVTLIFLSLTAFSDPGIFPRYTRPMARDWSYSNQAGSFRPPKVIFCRECKLLIDQYDHFCPWSGTVIGAKNIQYFRSFVSVLVLTMLYDAIIIIVALTTSEESSNSSNSSGSSGYGGTTTSSSGYGGMTTSTVYEETPLHDWFDPSAYIEVAASAVASAAASAATSFADS